MRISLFFFFLTKLSLLFAQNLVPNPSFEDTIVYSNGLHDVFGWENNIGTPNYFSAYYEPPLERFKTPVNYRGSQIAYDGVAYFGFGTFNGNRLNEREYLQIKLLDSLQKDLEYEIEFYISLADSFHRAMDGNNIGIAFRNELDNGIIDHRVREFRPYYTSDSAWNSTDKIGWQKFHYTHKAQGGEKVLAIGCFLKDVDIIVTTVGNGGNTNFFRSTAYYYIDQISVQWKDTSTRLLENHVLKALQLYPNPVKEDFVLKTEKSEALTFTLFNLKGQAIDVLPNREGKVYRFSVGHLPKGLYLLQVRNREQQRTFKVLKE
ncbi:MAG: T9SS type A sorting domain-containing protein [Flavobacteriales bacterium]|nr:T9SS type A sorting domain-containing protein [Flavobacteriales bacterium]